MEFFSQTFKNRCKPRCLGTAIIVATILVVTAIVSLKIFATVIPMLKVITLITAVLVVTLSIISSSAARNLPTIVLVVSRNY